MQVGVNEILQQAKPLVFIVVYNLIFSIRSIMDNTTKTSSHDESRINVQKDHELNYWADKFDVTKVKLKAAINAAGTSVNEVEAYLRKKNDAFVLKNN